MSTRQKLVKSLLVQSLWRVIGRRNLVRLGRFLSNEARLDVPNNSVSNGECAVQQCVLRKDQGVDTICVFDVGANVGQWTSSLLEASGRLGRQTEVYAFEPCNETFDTLKQNLEANGLSALVHINNVALSSGQEKRSFYSAGDNIGINGLYPIRETIPQKQTVTELETETLGNYCVKNGIAHIDYLKVDTEGHDLEVLYGAKNLFSAGAIDIAQFEYNHRWIAARHYLRDVFDYFVPLGYAIGKITPKGIEFYSAWDPELETFREGNYLLVRPVYKDIFPQIAWWKQ